MFFEYDEYIRSWLNGIKDEISFWDTLFASKGESIGLSSKEFDQYVQFEPPFKLDSLLKDKETRMLDVGSGPYSSCGIKTDKTNLSFVAVDPLAFIYKQLKDKYKIKTKVNPITGMVEFLSSQFAENEFDFVHMSNSLDHSFDPMLGIRQMLYVCKIGGKLILRHHDNEAEHANYSGFHQWNLSLENNKFIIWRKDKRVDVAKELLPYAEIVSVSQNPAEREHTVIIEKKSSFSLISNEQRNSLFILFLEKICQLSYESNLLLSSYLDAKLKKIVSDFTLISEHRNVFIYGIGDVSNQVYNYLFNNSVKVNAFFVSDNKDDDLYYGLPLLKFDPSLINEGDLIIIAANKAEDSIYNYIIELMSDKSIRYNAVKLSTY